jgi:magnesium transporter
MLSVYVPRGSTLERIPIEPGAPAPEAAVWIDLVTPTVQEDRLVEAFLGIAVPTREEMQEIEVSSRLYIENGARYMTATLMCQSDTATPKTTPVTFILSNHRLCTVRYEDPRPFAIVEHKLARACPGQGVGRVGADGSARRGDRPLRRHPGAHRRRGRPGLAFDLRAGR